MAKKKQGYLFGEPRDTRSRLTLNIPESTKGYMAAISRIAANFTLDEIKPLTNHIRAIFHDYHIVDQHGNDIPVIQSLDAGRPLRKSEHSEVLALLTAEDANFRTYIKLLPEEVQQVWEFCFRYSYVTIQEIKENIGVEVAVVTRRSYWSATFEHTAPAYQWFTLHKGLDYDDKDCYVSLHDEWRALYCRAVFQPNHSNELPLKGIPTLPPTVISSIEEAERPLHPYSNETGVMQQIELVEILLQRGTIDFGSTKMTATTIKRAAQSLHLPEAFPDTTIKEYKQLCANLFIPIMSECIHDQKRKKTETVQLALRQWTTLLRARCVYPYVQTHINGVKRSKWDYETRFAETHTTLWEVLTTLPDGWVSMQDLLMVFLAQNPNKAAQCMITPRFLYDNPITFRYDGHKVRLNDIQDVIGYEMVKGLLFFLATCGIVDIAVTDSEETSLTPYDTLEFVRLTDLGRYAVGLTDDYTPAHVKSSTEFFAIDESHLIIRSVTPDSAPDSSAGNPYIGLLNEMATPIGSERYKVTATTFLTGCNHRKDVEEKINLFRKRICPNPSAVWEQFFNNILARCNPLADPQQRYRLFKVDPHNTELLNFLATDPYIRQHTLRAEGHHLLIEEKAYTTVLNHFRKAGYLV